MIRNLIFNGKDLLSFGFTFKEKPSRSVAERDLELVEVYGADGAEILDSGGYKNVEEQYTINSIPELNLKRSEQHIVDTLIDWLYSDGEYKILRDTNNEGRFTYAVFKSPEKIENIAKGLHDTTITFSRKPFWYTDSGQEPIVYENNSKSISVSLRNPEAYSSLPLIKVTAKDSFALNVNGTTMKVKSGEGVGEMIFDSEKLMVLRNGIEVSNLISGDYFPISKPGENTITVTSNTSNPITKLEIVPRWRRL